MIGLATELVSILLTPLFPHPARSATAVEAATHALTRTHGFISSLPVEILLNILEHLPPNTPTSYVQKKQAPPRIVFTFVCSWFRQVGVGHKASWSQLPVEPTQWLDICLRRGESFRLDLSLKRIVLGTQSIGLVNRILDKHLPRIADLDVELTAGPYFFLNYTPGSSMFTLPATTHLKRLSFDYRNPSGEPSDAGSPVTRRCRLTLSNEINFRLQSLTLGACTIAPPILLNFRALAVLRLYDCVIWTSLGAMLETLAALPDLRVLSLSERGMAMNAQGLHPLALPRLEELELLYPLDTIATVLELLLLPPDVRLHLTHPRWCPLPRAEVAALGTRLGNALKLHLPAQPFHRGDGSLRVSVTPRLCVEGRWSTAGVGASKGTPVRNAETLERELRGPPDLPLVIPPLHACELPLLDEVCAILGFARCPALAVDGCRTASTSCASCGGRSRSCRTSASSRSPPSRDRPFWPRWLTCPTATRPTAVYSVWLP